MSINVDNGTGTKTLKQWSQELHVPHSTLRSAVRYGLLKGYQFVPNGGVYSTTEDMLQFLEESAERAKSAKASPVEDSA